MTRSQALSTLFTKRFGCRVPVVGAPMAGVSGGSLAAAVSRGGALGFVAAGHLASNADLRAQVAIFRDETTPGAALAIGFIGHSSMKDGPGRVESVLREHRPEVVQFFAPALVSWTDGRTNVKMAKDYGAKVMVQVGSVAEAREVLAAGVDCVVAQGREAGGHGLRTELSSGTLPLAARVVEVAAEMFEREDDRPVVLAAGGIIDGRGLVAALALGCDGAVLGTRLWASQESLGNPSLRESLLSAENDDVLRTRVFDIIGNSRSNYPWPQPFDSVGALHNDTSRRWHGKEDSLKETLKSNGDSVADAYNEAASRGDPRTDCVLSGEGVGSITSIMSAEDVIRQIEMRFNRYRVFMAVAKIGSN